MQFNSFIFIFLFLPLFLIAYFVTNRISHKGGKCIIILSGLLFYYFAGFSSFAVFLISAAANYIFALLIQRIHARAKSLLTLSILANAGLLLFYKYASVYSDLSIIMPLGISFFSFQQIMYLVGVYNNEITRVDLLDYATYITFFPKLIMGPLVEPVNLLSQLNDTKLRKVNSDNIAIGIKLFSFGLFKKLVLADTFMRGVEWGYANIDAATSADMLLTMLFYTFEIYFDFSGYTDMATGISKMMNISLPINFDSPYKALSIRDFWKRWHVSLTQFFTKYIYYPLGGSRAGKIRTYINIMIVFLISGIWHGANYTFILWGIIHGCLQVFERLLDKWYSKLCEAAKWIYSFTAVNILWLLFRSESISQWHYILYKIFTFQNTTVSEGLLNSFELPETPLLFEILDLYPANEIIRGFSLLIFTVSGFILCLVPENNYKSQERINIANMITASCAFIWGLFCLSSESVFVYFNF